MRLDKNDPDYASVRAQLAEEVVAMYTQLQMTTAQIAEEQQVSPTTVNNILHERGVPMRKQGPTAGRSVRFQKPR